MNYYVWSGALNHTNSFTRTLPTNTRCNIRACIKWLLTSTEVCALMTAYSCISIIALRRRRTVVTKDALYYRLLFFPYPTFSLKFALVFPLWKQVRSPWNFNAMYKMVAIRCPLLLGQFGLYFTRVLGHQIFLAATDTLRATAASNIQGVPEKMAQSLACNYSYKLFVLGFWRRH